MATTPFATSANRYARQVVGGQIDFDLPALAFVRFNEAGATTPRKCKLRSAEIEAVGTASMRPGQQRPGNLGVQAAPLLPFRRFNEAGATTPRKYQLAGQ